MQFQVTDIEFDFGPDLLDEEIKAIYDDHIGMIVEANNVDDMIKEIESTTGWDINSMDYRKLGSMYTETFRPEMNMDQLTMLSRREQLMEDIDSIVEGFYFDQPISDSFDGRLQLTAADSEELIRVLCDAVCKNFPTN